MMQGRYDLGGGGYFHMKETGMFLISLRGLICIVVSSREFRTDREAYKEIQ